MRVVIAFLGFFLSLLLPISVSAQGFDTPRALLEQAYSGYGEGVFPVSVPALFSQGLNVLFAADAKGQSDGGLGTLGFDPFVNAQDFDLTRLVIGDPVPNSESDGVDVVVTFENFGQETVLDFILVNEADGWKIDDIVHAGTNETDAWRLSEILGENPLLN